MNHDLREMMKKVVDTINHCTKSQLEDYLNKITEDAILDLKKTLDDAYYNDISLTDDWKYDIIKDRVEPDQGGEIGAPLHEKEVKIKLPIWLGSLDKIKSNECYRTELSKWVKKFGSDVMIMDKLDGVSCLYIYDKRKHKVSLYTRGDGKEGKDISYITNHIQGLPDPKKHSTSLMVRGELVIARRHDVQCSRNVVTGAVKGKKVTKHLKMVTFVAHEYISSSNESNIFLNISDQIKMLKDANFQVVHAEMSDIQNLSRMLRLRIQVSEYDIDGIVVHSLREKFFSRNVTKNPEYSFAYKEDLCYTVEVTDVKWSVSKAKLLKPVVHIRPINILGATVTCASGYNAKFIMDHRIGKGATISITRSGEVIPKIVEVIHPSSEEQLVYPAEKYDWNDTKVEYVLQDDENRDVKAKKLVHFAKVLGIKHLGPSTADKLITAGVDSVDLLLMCEKEEFSKLEAFKDLSVDRLYKNLHESWNASSLEMKMHASCCFPDGIGIKNFSEILKNQKLLSDNTEKVAVKKYNAGFPLFVSFMQRIGDTNFIPESSFSFPGTRTHDENEVAFLSGKKVVFSGFRDADLSAKIVRSGGQVITTVSSKTDLLIVATLDNSSSKINKAKELNIQVMTKEEFVSQF